MTERLDVGEIEQLRTVQLALALLQRALTEDWPGRYVNCRRTTLSLTLMLPLISIGPKRASGPASAASMNDALPFRAPGVLGRSSRTRTDSRDPCSSSSAASRLACSSARSSGCPILERQAGLQRGSMLLRERLESAEGARVRRGSAPLPRY